MINEILEVFNRGDVTDAFLFPERAKEALTAIYEIGLGVIGEDDKIGDPVEDSSIPMQFTKVNYRNSLREEQRLAWAKACGVAE